MSWRPPEYASLYCETAHQKVCDIQSDAEYVGRVVQVWKNGDGVNTGRGNMKAVIKATLTDVEAWSVTSTTTPPHRRSHPRNEVNFWEPTLIATIFNARFRRKCGAVLLR